MLHSTWGLSSPRRNWTHAPCTGSRVLTTGSPGKSHNFYSFDPYSCVFFFQFPTLDFLFSSVSATAINNGKKFIESLLSTRCSMISFPHCFYNADTVIFLFTLVPVSKMRKLTNRKLEELPHLKTTAGKKWSQVLSQKDSTTQRMVCRPTASVTSRGLLDTLNLGLYPWNHWIRTEHTD